MLACIVGYEERGLFMLLVDIAQRSLLMLRKVALCTEWAAQMPQKDQNHGLAIDIFNRPAFHSQRSISQLSRLLVWG
jgi:hypothetical protein